MSKPFQGKRPRIAVLLLSIAILSIWVLAQPTRANAGPAPCIYLSCYSVSMKIGESCPLAAITTDAAAPKFSSSKSSIASVNPLGIITAKSAGTCYINVKIKNAKSACRVEVQPTRIQLNETSVSLERGETFQLQAATSNGSKAAFKSSKKSVATVTEGGQITGHKPGETKITVSADKTKVTCRVTVRKPKVRLDPTGMTLFRSESRKISAYVSSGVQPKWRSSSSKVASVSESGEVTALKHGKATITATIDGVKRVCSVTVKSPKIILDQTEIELKAGQKTKLKAEVSSHNPPSFKSTNTEIVLVDDTGKVTAVKKGTAYIKVSEDGTTEKCRIRVTEEPKKAEVTADPKKAAAAADPKKTAAAYHRLSDRKVSVAKKKTGGR